MSLKKTPDLYVPFLMGVSFFALFLVGTLTVHPPAIQGDLPWRRPAIGSIYALTCILGISAVFFPRRCSRPFHYDVGMNARKTRSSQDASIVFGLRIVHGHHPHCEDFSGHEFRVGDKTFCVGCLGFFFGALVSLVGTVLYFFSGWQIGQESVLAVASGISGVALGLLQLPIFKIRGFLRLFPNAFLVVGTFLLLIGLDTLVRSVVVDLFLLTLSAFWVWTRISLSRWDHMRVCQACGF
ncbi:MAG: hypothetical protein ACE5Z5_11960, partial [Candidatus Bathyarchaeia archaeon]